MLGSWQQQSANAAAVDDARVAELKSELHAEQAARELSQSEAQTSARAQAAMVSATP